MRLKDLSSQMWGAPRKFDPNVGERRVSWLELFFDLVYVIAISRITHHLSLHLNAQGLLEFFIMFMMIFWGWVNGSLYHDLHGNEGLRTRLMTLWQMIIIAGFSITLDNTEGASYRNLTITLMVMQLYITYLWWSVGLYDQSHRKYNLPYTILFLISFSAMFLSLFVSTDWLRFLIPIVLICNYTPPFIAKLILQRDRLELSLSSSMFERFGLFTIIIFGELVLGVVNGMSEARPLDGMGLVNFIFALSIVFALWWIFFTLTSRAEPKSGFNAATFIELLFIPALISLGVIAACFNNLLAFSDPNPSVNRIFIFAIATLLISIGLLLLVMYYPEDFEDTRIKVRKSMWLAGGFFVLFGLITPTMNITLFLGVILALILILIFVLNSMYYALLERQKSDKNGDNG